jgi:hypothetical protein
MSTSADVQVVPPPAGAGVMSQRGPIEDTEKTGTPPAPGKARPLPAGLNPNAATTTPTISINCSFRIMDPLMIADT